MLQKGINLIACNLLKESLSHEYGHTYTYRGVNVSNIGVPTCYFIVLHKARHLTLHGYRITNPVNFNPFFYFPMLSMPYTAKNK